MTYPAVIFWILSLLALRSRGPSLYRLFFVAWSFGTLAMAPPQLIGASLFPAWILVGVMTARTMMDVGPRAYFGAVFDPRRFGVLTACTAYAIFSGIMLPRIFAGQFSVVSMRPDTLGSSGLAPTVSNIIQAVYFLLTTITVVNIYFAASEPGRRRALLEGFGWGAAAAVITGLMDMTASAAGLGGLLEPFRNATYLLLVDNNVGDVHRVIGLMSEASAYSALCVSFLAVLAITPEDRASAPWAGWRIPLSIALLGMTYLSTSSGGYLALAFLALIVLASVAIGAVRGRRPAWRAAYWILVLAAAAPGLALFRPQLVEAVSRMIDLVVFEKSNSASFADRSMWNSMAFQTFLHTGGLGAGIGCCRASSWVFAVLSNIGAPGAALMLAFLLQVFLMRAADPRDAGLLRLVKFAILPNLFVISLTSPAVNFGVGAAWLFGLGAALARPAVLRRTAPQAAVPARGAPALLTRTG